MPISGPRSILARAISVRRQEISEFDAVKLSAACAENSFVAMTVFVTFTFAYLATAFFIGTRLSRFQAFVASGLYIISASLMALASLIWLQALFHAKESSSTFLDVIPLLDRDMWLIGVSLILVGGMVFSLLFMWDVRRGKTE